MRPASDRDEERVVAGHAGRARAVEDVLEQAAELRRARRELQLPAAERRRRG